MPTMSETEKIAGQAPETHEEKPFAHLCSVCPRQLQIHERAERSPRGRALAVTTTAAVNQMSHQV